MMMTELEALRRSRDITFQLNKIENLRIQVKNGIELISQDDIGGGVKIEWCGDDNTTNVLAYLDISKQILQYSIIDMLQRYNEYLRDSHNELMRELKELL